MGNSLFIASRDIMQQLRQPATWIWLALMPPLFFFFIGTVTGGFSSSFNADQNHGLVIVAENPGVLKDQITKRLAEHNYVVTDWVEKVEPAEDGSEPYRVLTLSPNFSDGLGTGVQQKAVLKTRAGGQFREWELIRINRALYTVLADMVAAQMRKGARPEPADLDALNALPRLITLEVESAGKRQDIPSGFSQAIPGILVMFTMFVLLSTSGAQLTMERNQGLLRRLASAPMSRAEVVFGKWLSRMALGAIQLGLGITIGILFFKLNLGPDWAVVCLLLFSWAAFCSSAGLLLGSLASTEGQAGGLGALAANLLAALGGCWWPVEITPEWMQALQKFLPTGWAMNGFHKLVTFQNGPAAAMTELGLLLGAALVVGIYAARKFRYVT